MPSNKSQHYVPRTYLKNFSIDDSRKSTNLYLIQQDIFVEKVSIRDQCAHPYFYGRNLDIEHQLGRIEGQFADIIREAERNEFLNVEALSFLRFFLHLQRLRTENSISRQDEMLRATIDMGYEMNPSQTPTWSYDETVKLSLATAVDCKDMLADLRTVLVINESTRNFITSDDPCIVFNRFYSVRLRQPNQGAGVTAAGFSMFMPITPHIGCLVYDKQVYHLDGLTRNRVRVSATTDIDALNSVQFINCKNCVFTDQYNSEHLQKVRALTFPQRRDTWAEVVGAVPVETTDDTHVFRSTNSSEERANAAQMLIHTRRLNPEPMTWPRFMHFRSHPRFYDTRSGAGVIRKREHLEMRERLRRAR